MNNVKILFRRYVARNLSWFVELFYSIRMKMTSFRHKAPIIILTPGKVGSSSVYETLKQGINNPIYHLHRFSESGIINSTREHLQSGRKSRPLHLIVAKLLRKKLQTYSGEVYIITLVREPVSRVVSAFFQNTEFYKNEIESEGLQIDEQRAIEILKKNLESGITDQIEQWFDEEIKGNFSIDIFSTPYDEQNGYRIFNDGRFHLLLLKMEDIDANFGKGFQKLMGKNTLIELRHSNIGSEKFYSKSYKNVRGKISLSPDTIEEIIHSMYFQHFYSEKENEIRRKWGIENASGGK